MATGPGMWMGTRTKAAWVPAAGVNANFAAIGSASTTQFINGGAYVRRSRTTHKEYELAWGVMSRDLLRPVTDIASGLWGSGLIYFLDPMAMDKNVLPQYMAAPMLAGIDGLVLVGDTPPTLVPTPTNTLDYPVQLAQYGTSATRSTIYIPIPRGYTAWAGVHGDTTSTGTLAIHPLTDPTTYAAATRLPMLAVTSSTRVSNSFSGDTYVGIEVYVENNAKYAGAMIQILPNGITPSTGGFISGQGNSGCDFDNMPAETAYSAALDMVGMTAKLIEIGAWA